SPFLEGVSLQSSSFDMGKGATNRPKGGNEAGFYDVHLWEFPILVMLKLLIMGDCTAEPYIDPSLTYISEVDPLWENDLLTLVLNPEAVVFANPIASMWCAADCVKVTAGADNLSAHFCAGCDGNLYPLTGHVFANDDSVRVSSLLTQRMITKLHRQGMLMKTMG
ncbi:TraU family protein, partial [Klebsiella pneumoniae]